MSASLMISILRRVPYGPVRLSAAEYEELRRILVEYIVTDTGDRFRVRLSDYMHIDVERRI